MNTVTAPQEVQVAPDARLAPASQFATVPEVTLPSGIVVPSFQVARYLTGKSADGTLLIASDAAPYVEISYHDAIAAACGAGLALITELQYLALAHDIASVAANWTGGAVGEGDLKQGLRNGEFDEAQPASVVSESPDEDRHFVLSNGEIIDDVAGNACSWVFDNVQGDDQGILKAPFADDSISLTTAPYPSRERGTGWRPGAGAAWSGYALIRGGYWDGGDYAGVFRLSYARPGDADDYVGFRCTKPE